MSSAASRSLLAQRTASLELSGTRKMIELALKIPGVIRLEVGEPDFATPDYIISAVKADLDSKRYTHYTTILGYPELRRALAAKWEKETGQRLDAEYEVLPTAGGASAVYAAIMVLVDPGDDVLIPDPGYPQYTQMTRLVGGKPVYYPLREETGFQPVAADIERLLSPRSKVLVLNTPHNPTGGVLSRESLAMLASFAREHNLAVVADEVYSTLVFDGSQHISIATLPGMFERTVTINSFSKAYAMTGWRLGYAVGPKNILWEMAKLHGLINTCTSAISQRAGLAALSQSADSEAMTTEYDRRRRWLVDALNQIPGFRCPRPLGAFYVFPNISAFGLSSQDFALRLLDAAHVTCVPGSAFGPTGEGHVRMSYATAMEDLQTAVERIREALPSLRRA